MRKWTSLLLAVVLCTCAMPAGAASREDNLIAASEVWMYGKIVHPWWDVHSMDDWDAGHRDLITRISSGKLDDDIDLYFAMLDYAALLEDGHAGIHAPDVTWGRLPAMVDWNDGAFYLLEQDVQTNALVPYRIAAMDGLDTETLLHRYGPLVGHKAPNAYEMQTGNRLSVGRVGEKHQFDLVDDAGNALSKTYTFVEDSSISFPPLAFEKTAKEQGFTRLYKSDIFTLYRNETQYYLRIHTFAPNEFTDDLSRNALPKMKDATEVILDVRYNAGGNSGNGLALLASMASDRIILQQPITQNINSYAFAVGSAMSADESLYGEMFKGMESYRDTFAFRNLEASGSFAPLPLSYWANDIILEPENIYVLTWHKSGSAVDDFAHNAAQISNATLIGTNTSGATGSIAILPLANGWEFTLSSARDVGQDGVEITNHGIAPDEVVWQDPWDWSEDTVLSYTIEKMQTSSNEGDKP